MSRQVWEKVKDKADKTKIVEAEEKRTKEGESVKRKEERI